jgi:hypothetical protein
MFKEARMLARIAGSMVVSVAVLLVVSLLVSLGVLRWTGSVITSAAIGTLCGLAAAFAMDSLYNAVRRAAERHSHESYRCNSGGIADHGRPAKHQGVDPKGSQK